ncbi:uncharacterized protein LOC143350145 [Colletes latitarsis]|uniref:uncharacterized protein LOC143350145 n=1 Tax=Colletes latitarsis TaxID=2605962 RepID=UPI004035C140
MRKLFVMLFAALLVVSLVNGCKPPGVVCADDKDCCAPLVCNPWAGRCTKKPAPPTPVNPPQEPSAPADDSQ